MKETIMTWQKKKIRNRRKLQIKTGANFSVEKFAHICIRKEERKYETQTFVQTGAKFFYRKILVHR